MSADQGHTTVTRLLTKIRDIECPELRKFGWPKSHLQKLTAVPPYVCHVSDRMDPVNEVVMPRKD